MDQDKLMAEIQNEMMKAYKRGYREGFDDLKENAILIVEALKEKDIPIDKVISIIREIDYE